MNRAASGSQPSVPLSRLVRLDKLCDEFEQLWREGRGLCIEEFLARVEDSDREYLLRQLLAVELELRQRAGASPDLRQYCERFPDDTQLVEAAFALARQKSNPPALTPPVTPPANPYADTAAHDGQPPTGVTESPMKIGRYAVHRVLGRGGFAVVYLAYDPHVDRLVAIKVPRLERFENETDLDQFIREAARAAKLEEHPRIVRVHDVHREPGLVYIVEQYIAGRDLAAFIKAERPSPQRIAELMSQIAEAVEFAHERGFLHRDLKPANILMNESGEPHLADFGLALHWSELWQHQGQLSGTCPYMSPEQVRGESHRLDGRSDIWSLGVILYELIAGRRPFVGRDVDHLFYEIEHDAPPALRQFNSQTPDELARICQSCLAKRASDRYQSARELVADLRHFLKGGQVERVAVGREIATKVVPSGLRSFDASAANFFLELLPGPCDREGLPHALRFWKTRIEETGAQQTFAVGVMYGPSGCGKSSLVKAGLLPRLAQQVVAVYVESTAEDTEVRLLKAIRKHCPELPTDIALPELTARLRTNQGSRGRKVLILLDQFEQWLHAPAADGDGQLAAALRQCDGSHLQCLVLVRDDFWMSLTRFMRALEVPLLEGFNCVSVDLFDLDHARKVLAAFGRAYGKLPEPQARLSRDQMDFIDSSIDGLAEGGQVISVRLALFAEMMKGRPWTIASLRELGGAEGVGVTFLEETFSSMSAPAAHRRHEQAIRAVLKALLPKSNTDIRGHLQPLDRLIDTTGYVDRRADFAAVLSILDKEVRLITPTEPDASAGDDDQIAEPLDAKYYQLTHDYFVPSIREWLLRKQKQTRRGRAEIRLAERADAWTAKQENRNLPSLWEYLNIRTLTSRKTWTDWQRATMAKAGRLHRVRGAVAIVFVMLLGCLIYESNGRFRSAALVDSLVAAKEDAVLPIVQQMRPYRRWTNPRLQMLLANEPDTPAGSRKKLHARLALLADDAGQVPVLKEALLAADTAYVGVLRDSLRPYQSGLVDDLWKTLKDVSLAPDRRFRAGLALAAYQPDSNHWNDAAHQFLVQQLISANPEHQPRLREYLRPIRDDLIVPLERLYADSTNSESHQLSTANALADFAADDRSRLTRLLSEGTTIQYKVLYARLGDSNDRRAALKKFIAEQPAAGLPPSDRLALGRRRASAAVTLLRWGAREEIFPALRVVDDPESLTQFVHGCRARGVSPKELLACLRSADALRQAKTGAARNKENCVLFALLLALGEFELLDMPADQRKELIDQLTAWYAADPSAGIHGASGWLLRRWGCDEQARQVDQTPLPLDATRDWFTLEIKTVPKGKEVEQSFYMTFVVVYAGQYVMGSPVDEPYRSANETRHKVWTTRPYAILDREITREEFEAFGVEFAGYEQTSKTVHHPMNGPNWYDAVRFCRWLTKSAGMDEADQAYADPEGLGADVARDPSRRAGNAPRNWPLDLDRPGFRLPTEAEWEIACRADTTTAWFFGHDEQLLDRYAWYVRNSGDALHPPRTLRPNLWGLFDVSGNVLEWCHDWQGRFRDVEDPLGPDDGLVRCARGLGWLDEAAHCRSANRSGRDPSVRGLGQGLRVAFTLTAGAGGESIGVMQEVNDVKQELGRIITGLFRSQPTRSK